MFNKFEMMKITLKTVLRIFLRKFKTVSRKSCINRSYKSKSSQFSYTVIVVARTMKYLSVVTSLSIYHGCSTWKTLWEDNSTLASMRSCGRRNVRKHKEINNGEHYIALDISLGIGFFTIEKSPIHDKGIMWKDLIRG